MPNRSPNVIVFFTDQQRHDSTGVHGNPLGLTPNFDRLAHEGTHLANLFTCQPVCGPARSCLQTGQYATTTGVWRNGFGIDPEAVTLAKRFDEAGYRTGYFGKWHLAPREAGGEAVPEQFRAGYHDWLAANAIEHTSDAYRTRVWDNDNNPVDLPGYRVDALTDRLIKYIDDRSKEDQPFFAMMSLLEPHHQNHRDDYPAPTGYEQMYAGRWTPPDLQALPAWEFEPGSETDRATIGGSAARHLGGYWGMVKRCDEAFGRVLDALKSLNIDDNTIVLFTTDHACHFKTRNAEYKRSCHESSIRIPGVITGPGFKGGGRLDQIISLVDLPATLLDGAGLDVPDTMQGRSIKPLVQRDTEGWPEEAFVQISESCTARAIRTSRWKYCVTADPEDVDGGRASKYYESHLYDLEADPYELVNRLNHKAFDEVRKVLRGRLLTRMRQAGEDEPEIAAAQSTQGPGQVVISEMECQL
jgi:arylsulfatase A-like enzyme